MLFENINPYLRFVRYLKIDSDASYSVHMPYDARMFYTTSGDGTITAEGKNYSMNKGCMLIVPAGVGYILETPETNVVYLAVNFDYTRANADKKTPIPPNSPEHFDSKSMTDNTTFRNMTSFNSPLYFTDMFSVEKRLEELEREFSRKMVLHELKTSSIFAEILADCARMSEAMGDSRSEKTIEKIISYIHSNSEKNITNIEIGELFGFHPNYVSSVIKKYTGMPLHKYLLHIRIENAVKLLEAGNDSVGDVAKKCGVCDIYYFSKYFKKITGMPPGKV